MKSFLATLLLVIAGSLAAADGDAAKPLDIDGLKFTVPSGWKAMENTSAMRKAVLGVTVDGVAEPITAIFFHFGGGDVDSNIARWKGQLTGTVDTKTEEVDANGTKVTMFKGTGTYTDPFGGKGAQENYALIGALIPVADSGPVVIKMAGPKDATLGLYEALKKMATSVTK